MSKSITSPAKINPTPSRAETDLESAKDLLARGRTANGFTFIPNDFYDVMSRDEATFFAHLAYLTSNPDTRKEEFYGEQWMLCTISFLENSVHKWHYQDQKRKFASLKARGFVYTIRKGTPPLRYIRVDMMAVVTAVIAKNSALKRDSTGQISPNCTGQISPNCTGQISPNPIGKNRKGTIRKGIILSPVAPQASPARDTATDNETSEQPKRGVWKSAAPGGLPTVTASDLYPPARESEWDRPEEEADFAHVFPHLKSAPHAPPPKESPPRPKASAAKVNKPKGFPLKRNAAPLTADNVLKPEPIPDVPPDSWTTILSEAVIRAGKWPKKVKLNRPEWNAQFRLLTENDGYAADEVNVVLRWHASTITDLQKPWARCAATFRRDYVRIRDHFTMRTHKTTAAQSGGCTL